MKNLLVILAIAIAVSGCKQRVKIINGELPEGMVSHASKFMGEYAGDLDGRPMHLTLAMEGNKVVLSSSADWLDQGCSSVTGDLKEMYVKNKKNEMILSKAVFYFDAGQCSAQVWGRELELKLKDKTPLALSVSIFARTESYWSCYGPRPYPYVEVADQSIDPSYVPGPGHPGYNPPHYPNPYDNCRNYLDTYVLSGRFSKIQ
ncbi:MAG TPA: hypothetical protein DCS07_12925 [Bdellovibrionales bacterium]|nr:hypothetical protein [Bdellovibrionales bacterium]